MGEVERALPEQDRAALAGEGRAIALKDVSAAQQDAPPARDVLGIVGGVRRVLLEVGRRLAEAGAIDALEDVFYLELEEVRETAAAPTKSDRRALVAARKSEMDRFRHVQAPPLLGSMPPVPPGDSPVDRMLARVFGAPPQPTGQPREIHGLAGSAGAVRGRARIIRIMDEADALEPGDVLVAPSTTSPWTVLFATTAGVVTDAGGALSHSAIVAREYRIPAVVGTGMATTVIKDGQIIEVDGDAGLVRLIEV